MEQDLRPHVSALRSELTALNTTVLLALGELDAQNLGTGGSLAAEDIPRILSHSLPCDVLQREMWQLANIDIMSSVKLHDHPDLSISETDENPEREPRRMSAASHQGSSGAWELLVDLGNADKMLKATIL